MPSIFPEPALAEHLSVVGREGEQRVVRLAAPLHGVPDPADPVVDAFDLCGVAAPDRPMVVRRRRRVGRLRERNTVVAVEQFLAGIEIRVRAGEVYLQEPRLPGRQPVEQAERRPAREVVDLEEAAVRAGPRGDPLPVLVVPPAPLPVLQHRCGQPVLVQEGHVGLDGLGPSGDGGAVAVAGVIEGVGEAHPPQEAGPAVAAVQVRALVQVALAAHRHPVAGRAQGLHEGRQRRIGVGAVVGNAAAAVAQARSQAGAAGRAHRACHPAAAEGHAARGEPVQVGRANRHPPLVSHPVPAVLVGKDEQDVGGCRAQGGRHPHAPSSTMNRASLCARAGSVRYSDRGTTPCIRACRNQGA